MSFFCVSFTTLLEMVLRGSLRNRMLEKKNCAGSKEKGDDAVSFFIRSWVRLLRC